MSREDFNNALNHIDYDLVEEYVCEKERLKKRARQKRQLAHYARAAACLLIAFCVAIPIIIFTNPLLSIPPHNTDGGKPTYTSTTPMHPENQEPGAPQDPSDDGVVGPEAAGPSALKFSYCFAYNGTEYICSFGTYDQSLNEALQTDCIDPKNVGEHIGEVMVTDNNGQREWFRLYGGDGSNLIIEIDGYYMIAQRK